MRIKSFLKELIPYIIIILVVVIIRMFIVTPVRVDGPSMNPTLEDKQLLILSKYQKKYERFDIIVFNHHGEKLVKRIIGLPGDKVEYKNNLLYINGEMMEESFEHIVTSDFKLSDIGYDIIPDDMYFVVGDNRKNSLDSRYIGLISKEDIEGVVNLSLWPLKKIK